jgi:hypothetical protein
MGKRVTERKNIHIEPLKEYRDRDGYPKPTTISDS